MSSGVGNAWSPDARFAGFTVLDGGSDAVVFARQDSVGVLWALGVALAIHTGAGAQVGQNINVITGSDSQFTGDMFRQRQTEPVAASRAFVNVTRMV